MSPASKPEGQRLIPGTNGIWDSAPWDSLSVPTLFPPLGTSPMALGLPSRRQRPTAGLWKPGSVPSALSPNHPAPRSEILKAYWVSNNNFSGSGEALCRSHLPQQHPEASHHQKRALIISGDLLVRWHLEAPLCSLPALADRGFCPGWLVEEVMPLLPKGCEH